jgi:hypothetical protein
VEEEEVADTDADMKAQLHAGAGLKVVHLVDLRAKKGRKKGRKEGKMNEGR